MTPKATLSPHMRRTVCRFALIVPPATRGSHQQRLTAVQFGTWSLCDCMFQMHQSHSVCLFGGAPYAVSRWSYCLQHVEQCTAPDVNQWVTACSTCTRATACARLVAHVYAVSRWSYCLQHTTQSTSAGRMPWRTICRFALVILPATHRSHLLGAAQFVTCSACTRVAACARLEAHHMPSRAGRTACNMYGSMHVE
jgi:hypothetical protein